MTVYEYSREAWPSQNTHCLWPCSFHSFMICLTVSNSRGSTFTVMNMEFNIWLVYTIYDSTPQN
uniref:Uncharacterized protein n=1 Tax=Anguilla anguilla TaxID=7936 RepID=A0A0E9XJU1_ANGAN